MTDTAITRLQNTLKCDLARKNCIGRECILKRFSQWLWSAWRINRADPHDGGIGESTDRPKTTTYTYATRKTPIYTLPAPEESTESLSPPDQPCKACKAWGVPCDQQRPRCSHCLDQQILCFYVPPVRKSTRKSTKSTKQIQPKKSTPQVQET
ncbi:uncharacterized protein BO97DRAFT_28355 [Aspergillus homomorphus CBS 101889]|uniref:Zn(2)-C6 fungal-type domain-containing protein n=1 Tax=Aspergillus homomorphus (strain CBS 101889) TaxID=1450537 RepID=A0A395I106_ASPHC|nr:hypothetical protein BO97DRAFT_28355 [Aspergillus homomorphus CBS 101889]RAL13871.1 hypothetical protein BO97DRAFT_28355 [Aspergillus homomorphus CBS 101889]